MNAPRAEARRWFQQAQADMAVVRTLRSAGHHAAACFHSQQAAEKALKNDRCTSNVCPLRSATNVSPCPHGFSHLAGLERETDEDRLRRLLLSRRASY